MPQIHPTATVDPRAELAPDVCVGPQCVITGDVRIGAGTRLIGHVYLQGPVTLGQRNVLYPFVTVGFEAQHLTEQANTSGVVIGDDNVLREGVTIHRSTREQPTRMGNHNMLMVASHLAHDVVIGDHNILPNSTLIAGHAVIADRVTFGGNALVAQHCRIGRLAMVSGVQILTRDLPPFCVVYNSRRVQSLNIVGLRRAGLRDHIKPLNQAFDLLFKKNHTIPKALDLIESQCGDDPLCAELVSFCRSAKRGITRYRSNDDED